MLPEEHDRLLREAIEQINAEAQAIGLRPYPIVFDVVPDEIMFELVSYVVPGRFSHWSHGREYERQKTLEQYGYQRLYETVLNTNICQAYLLDRNTLAQNKMIAAHVVGHSDFFANNGFFADSPNRMDRTMNLHADQIREFEDRFGVLEVEALLDAVLSIDKYVDPHTANYSQEKNYQEKLPHLPPKSPYDDLWVGVGSDSDWLGERRKAKNPPRRPHTPNNPDHDLMRFIMDHSPTLRDWERDVMAMIREESLYFAPNRRTKIINEGWATLVHTIIMRRLNLSVQEHLDFSKFSSGVTGRIFQKTRDKSGKEILQESLNPYHLGYNTLDYLNRKNGGDDENLAPEVLAIREYASDTSLIRDYLDEGLVARLTEQKTVSPPEGLELPEDQEFWELQRDRLAASLYNNGLPEIVAVDGDHGSHRGLYLRHIWDGQQLDIPFAEKTLEHIYRLWGRKVYLETKLADDGDVVDIVMSYSQRKGHESNILEYDD